MNLRTYNLTNKQKAKLVKGVTASLSLPIVDSLEDFIWEAVFCYAKGVKLFDPLFAKRSKLLFDIVNEPNKIGWSAKSLQCYVRESVEFELVIQRADVFKKRDDLGFPNLDINSSPKKKHLLLLCGIPYSGPNRTFTFVSYPNFSRRLII